MHFDEEIGIAVFSSNVDIVGRFASSTNHSLLTIHAQSNLEEDDFNIGVGIEYHSNSYGSIGILNNSNQINKTLQFDESNIIIHKSIVPQTLNLNIGTNE